MMEYDFEELQLPGYGLGLLLYGKAIIADDGCDEPFVTRIFLDGGKTLPAPNTADMSFDAMLFRSIAEVLEDYRTEDGMAVLERWADHLAGASEPDPDYLYEQARDRREGF